MTLSDWINISLSIASFILAATSIIIVILTLKQNSLMIENESRAYISIYGDSINANSLTFYLIVKNFGKSNAKIISFECDTDLSPFSYVKNHTPFLNIQGSSLAPNQSYKCAIDHIPLFNSGLEELNFKLSYKCNNKIYQDDFSIKLKSFSDLVQPRDNVKNKELQAIYSALDNLNERLL